MVFSIKVTQEWWSLLSTVVHQSTQMDMLNSP